MNIKIWFQILKLTFSQYTFTLFIVYVFFTTLPYFMWCFILCFCFLLIFSLLNLNCFLHLCCTLDLSFILIFLIPLSPSVYQFFPYSVILNVFVTLVSPSRLTSGTLVLRDIIKTSRLKWRPMDTGCMAQKRCAPLSGSCWSTLRARAFAPTIFSSSCSAAALHSQEVSLMSSGNSSNSSINK